MVVAVMGSLYKDSLGMITAIYELAFSASLAVGPLMGGFLYELKGFYLPFAVAGKTKKESFQQSQSSVVKTMSIQLILLR
jgi:MFS family permease